MKEKLIAEVAIEGQNRVRWTIDNLGRHTITYGAHCAAFSRLDDLNSFDATYEFGRCVRHAAECDGRFDT